MSKTKEVKKILKTIFEIIKTLLTIVVIIMSLIIIIQRVSGDEHSFFGYRIYRVLTGSMIPKYQIGDVLLVKETKVEDLKVGDDVTYDGEEGNFTGMIVTHQIIKIDEVDGEIVIQTKGIANRLEDPKIRPDQINGVVQCRLQILTTIMNLLSNGYVFYFGAIIPITIYIFFTVIKGGNKRLRDLEAKRNNDE